MDIAIRDACLPLSQGQTLFEAVRGLGLQSVELLLDAEGAIPSVKGSDGAALKLSSRASVIAFNNRLQDEGVHVCALLLGTDFSSDASDAHVDRAVRAARLAAELGIPVIRLDTHTARKDLPAAQVQGNFTRAAERILAATKDTGVDLAMENHAFFSNDPAFLDGIFAAVNDPRLGLTLDTGNFYWFGHPLGSLYALFKKYAGRTRHTHIKNINYPDEMARKQRPVGWEYLQYRCPLDEGNIDLARVVGILSAAGYRRALCIENESLSKYPEEQRTSVLKRDVAALKAALENA